MLLTPITKCIAEQREGWRKLDSTPSVSRQRSSASRWMAMLRGETALNHSSPRAEVVMRYLIVNGDDFGASPAINRGIMEAHLHGILTSTSILRSNTSRSFTVNGLARRTLNKLALRNSQ